MNQESGMMKKPGWLKDIKALGWDLDGTLYASSAELSSIIKHKLHAAVADKHGWDLSRAERKYEKRYRRLGSNTKTAIFFGIDGMAFFVKFWDEVDLGRFIAKDKRIIQMFRNLTDKRHFIISNSNRVDQIERKLALIGLKASVFEFLVSTVDLDAVKPDSKSFLEGLERLQLEPNKVLFIGDRVDTDIMGARGVGMRTCLVWSKSDEADVSLESVYQVSKLF